MEVNKGPSGGGEGCLVVSKMLNVCGSAKNKSILAEIRLGAKCYTRYFRHFKSKLFKKPKIPSVFLFLRRKIL